MNINESIDLFEKSKKLMPGGVNSPVRAFGAVGGTPLFIKSAKGCRVFDEDGNSFIDYVSSWGPAILGHSHERVLEAVKKTVENGLTFGAPTRREFEIAEIINSLVPSMEMLRLVNSGTEAVMSAVRAARGFTGRDKIVKFQGCYHGHSDGLLVKSGSGLMTEAVADSAGVPKDYAKNTLVAEYNSFSSVEEIFALHGNDIACVIVEPVAANMGVIPPAEGFLKFLRDVTKKYGALLIFDEVITGFRISLGGAQEYYGIVPDMTTLGKIVGGGMPVGAYGGRRDVMATVAPLGNVYQAGTLAGNPVAVAAGIETLKILMEDKDIYNRIDKKGAAIENAFKMYVPHVKVNRVGSLVSAFFSGENVTDYRSAAASDTGIYSKYFHFMLENGIYVAPSQFEAMFVSDSHGKHEIEKTVEAIKRFGEELAL
ncbi:MAG: glutamate-1-semialdehyde 2,1-aminomutase [Firmicutes bacterium]|nr:glutamate-1-semialdehyde 2,1-aminomutase [Bacillota bacterium]